jgi:hypothetical protein
VIRADEINRDDVVTEVLAAFERYEAALVVGASATLNAMFWHSSDTIRFGVADRQRGFAELTEWRATQDPLPGRRRSNTHVVTFGADLAVVTTLFGYPGRRFEGRQTQTWVRLAEGWRIVSAHVSETATAAVDG